MRNKLFYAGILISLAVSIILAGCPDSGGSAPENPLPLSVAVNQPVSLLEIDPSTDALSLAASVTASMTRPKAYTGTATVSLLFEDSNGETQSEDVGTISGGTLTLTLPADVDESLLPPLTLTEGITLQPPAAKALTPSFIATENGAVKGILIFGTYTVSPAGVGIDSIQYMYFPQATTIKGKGSLDASQPDNITFDVTGKKGWNELLSHAGFSGIFTDLTTVSGTMTSDFTKNAGMRWWLISLDSSKTPEPPTPPMPAGGTIADNAPVYLASSYPAGAATLYTENATVKLSLGQENREVGVIAHGKLTITLPETLEDELLTPLSYSFSDSGFTITPADAQGISSDFVLFDGDEEIGVLILEKTSVSMSAYKYDSVRYMYFPQETAIAGTVQSESGSLGVQINARPGWNPIYTGIIMTMSPDTSGGMSTIVTSDVTQVPSGLKWTATID
ncbi:MAG: hypothetical protein LBG73_07615 [Spirochaetaceae bacterium]|jgi:hypothetical protein|nr:hypothetical protein [Spirochaetaceae bacterium]